MGFVHLHLHTEYSLLDGSTQVSKLFPKLKELGMDTVAITEHGNMFGCIQKYKAAKKHGIKLIFGMETYLVDDMSKKDKSVKCWDCDNLECDLTTEELKNLDTEDYVLCSCKANIMRNSRVAQRFLTQGPCSDFSIKVTWGPNEEITI